MLFLLSKLSSYFLSPFVWLIGVLVFALLNRNSLKKKVYLYLFIFLSYFFSCPIVLQFVGRAWDIKTTKIIPTHYSCAIILGGYVGNDRNGNGFFSSFSDRFIQGVRLYNLKYVDHLLVSGGNSNIGKDTLFKEADYVAVILHEINIPDSAVLKENRARNTYENMIFCGQLLKERNLKPPYLLITSAFHMRRSLMLFKEKGIPVVPYSCDYIVSYNKFKLTDLLPNIETLSTWNIYIHEMVGLLVYQLKSKVV
ncbi:MAG: YdcF family protein [Bacteroidetes bacterium]|nr:YdcF family protein [Bacteroidota bacterium]